MPRDITPALAAALDADVLYPAYLFELALSESTLRLWDGTGALVWNSQEWQGNGWLQEPRFPGETGDVVSEGFTVTLSSVPTEVISLLLNEARQGYRGVLYIAALTSAGQVIADPYMAAEGLLDVPDFIDEQSTSTVVLGFESVLHDLDNANESRYADAEQQRKYPGDVGFQYVAELLDKRIFWGTPGDIPRTTGL